MSIVRLRDGRIGFSLPSNFELNELAAVARTKTSTFDALTGFGIIAHKPKRSFVSIALILCSLCVGGLVWQGSVATTAKEPKNVLKSPSAKIAPACSNGALVGQSFVWANGKHEISVQGVHLGLLAQQQLGGYLQLTLTSQCDHKRIRLSAWLEDKQYRITSVN